jgi:septal ring factor EnvC (AmiA/AmiB activator)
MRPPSMEQQRQPSPMGRPMGPPGGPGPMGQRPEDAAKAAWFAKQSPAGNGSASRRQPEPVPYVSGRDQRRPEGSAYEEYARSRGPQPEALTHAAGELTHAAAHITELQQQVQNCETERASAIAQVRELEAGKEAALESVRAVEAGKEAALEEAAVALEGAMAQIAELEAERAAAAEHSGAFAEHVAMMAADFDQRWDGDRRPPSRGPPSRGPGPMHLQGGPPGPFDSPRGSRR